MAKFDNFLAIARGVVSDDDYDEAMKLLDGNNFEDKASLGKGFEDFLGYNPINHHDRLFLESAFDEILPEAPDSLKERLSGDKDAIIESTLGQRASCDEEYLFQLLIAQIYSDTGWLCKSQMVDLSNAIFDEVTGTQFVEDTEEQDESEDEESDETTEDDDDSDGEEFEPDEEF